MTANQIETAAQVAEEAWDGGTLSTPEYMRELIRLATYGDEFGQLTQRAMNVGRWADANKNALERKLQILGG